VESLKRKIQPKPDSQSCNEERRGKHSKSKVV
jgi:hypothetical protein